MTKKSVTLDDIAAHTGLSKYSVSRALAEKSGVSAETRERIQEVARAWIGLFAGSMRILEKGSRVV